MNVLAEKNYRRENANGDFQCAKLEKNENKYSQKIILWLW